MKGLGSETQHILVTGSHGAGKTQAIQEVLAQVRQRKERAIVYDVSGQFIERFYREGKDTVLNPLDERCPAWDIWCEARYPADFDTMAASLIPEQKGGGDPFWTLAARTLFATVASRMMQQPERSNKKLLQDLLTTQLDEAAELVKNSEASAIIEKGAEKTALSVRATLAAYIRPLKFLRDAPGQFSLRNWVSQDTGDRWVFISARADQMETLRPLISLWLDTASSSMMSLDPDRKRRIWIAIDELPSLHKLPSLGVTLAQSRKYGGCCVLGFQSYAQLADVYGPRGAETIAGLCASWVVFRANEPAMAKWCSESFGNVENIESSEGLSYGANTIRDGVTLSAQKRLGPLVLPTEIMNLPDLHGYLRFPGDVPIVKFSLTYKERKKMAPAFLAADISPLSFDLSLPTRPLPGGDAPEEEAERGASDAPETPDPYRSPVL